MLTERGRSSKIEDIEIDQKENIRLKDFNDSARKLDKIYENVDGDL
jgi:hypothetical protein